jgi:hypothetical protein
MQAAAVVALVLLLLSVGTFMMVESIFKDRSVSHD